MSGTHHRPRLVGLVTVAAVLATACGGTYHPETPDVAALVQVEGGDAAAPAGGGASTPAPAATSGGAPSSDPTTSSGGAAVAPATPTAPNAPTSGEPGPVPSDQPAPGAPTAAPSDPQPGATTPPPTTSGSFPVADIGADRPANSGGRILLGIVGPHTGPIALQGLASLRGVQAVIAQYNAAGGIQGTPIELLIADDQFDPVQGRRHVQRMINEDKIFAMMGMVTPATFTQSLPDFEASGTLMMLGDGAASTGGSRLVFPSYQECPTAMSAATEYAIRDLGFQQLGIMQIDIEVSRVCADAIQATAEAMGAQITQRTGVTPGGIGCDSQAQGIAGSGAETVLIQAETLTMIRCIQALRQAGFQGPVGLSSNAIDDDALVDALGADAEGIYSTSGFKPKTDPATRAFCTDVIDTYYPDSGATQYLGYASCVGTRALLDALVVLGPDATTPEVIGYLESQPYTTDGMSPPLDWSAPDHEPYRAMRALAIANGVWEIRTEPFEPAFGS